ncbi:MAG: biopolymer transporter ExbD [Deltaproteobacteria bacterium]|nr:biopolymer transporter ExbD [Deltaproteobacteria bacterium]
MKIRSFAKTKKKARIEIIPMIDTMFFLLVFFMIATLSMTVMRGMQVNLPKADAVKKDIKENLSVTISKDGKIYFNNKKETSIPELRGALVAEVSANPDTMVIINADEEVLHGKVVEVMDEIKLSGVTKLAIATKQKDKKQ